MSKWRIDGISIFGTETNEIIGLVYNEEYLPLIAAAPELLEALKGLVHSHDAHMGPSAKKLRIELAQTAITQATGESRGE